MKALSNDQYKEICNILSKYSYDFYIYGSRAKGTHRKYSDLDLCYKGDMTRHEKALLEMDLEESNLPFRVDLVSWNKISDDFKSCIENDMKLLS